MSEVGFWTPERRDTLRAALRKVQAIVIQRERLVLKGDEAFLLYRAADDWDGMMAMLDEWSARPNGPLGRLPARSRSVEPEGIGGSSGEDAPADAGAEME